ncbi:MAG: ABC transporter substrate-binding protein [Planctomycetes bacterium]|nr:ABC transporter substrate-binding protein [Planctomycetota bacterium]
MRTAENSGPPVADRRVSSKVVALAIVLVALAGFLYVSNEAVSKPADDSASGGAISNNWNSPDVSKLAHLYPRAVELGSSNLTLDKPPTKIVSQTMFSDHVLTAICDLERIYALSKEAASPQYSNCVDEARKVGRFCAENAEQIVSMEPDLVIVTHYTQPDMLRMLTSLDIPLFQFSQFDTVLEIQTNIRTLAKLVGEDAKAEMLIAEMQAKIDRARLMKPVGAKTPRILSLIGAFSVGSGTLFDELITTLGAVNVCAEQGLREYPGISDEQIVSFNPDIILTSASNENSSDVRAELLANEAVLSTNAGRDGRVIVIAPNLYYSVSHWVGDLYLAVARAIWNVPG